MEWPSEAGVMVLPNAILFPQAYLPLYIFEPGYRRMLADSLETHRMFCVALQRPGTQRKQAAAVGGLGLVRAARTHADGTTHLILQGLARVELGPALRYRPYRVHPVRPLASNVGNTNAIDALAARLLELVADQLKKGALKPGLPGGVDLQAAAKTTPAASLQHGVEILAQVQNPEQIADLVSWAMLKDARQRQVLLETLDVETRLRRLIRFLSKPPGSALV